MHAPMIRFLGRRAYSQAVGPLINEISLPAAHVGTIKILTLNRPDAKNAISRALLKELSDHINAIKLGEDTSTRVLVIGSEVHGVFCSGADLKERAGFTIGETVEFLSTLRKTLRDLSMLPVPTISAISSLALGGGFELALATDLRVVSPAASFALPETTLGIVPGAGGTFRLPMLVGKAAAMDMILTGRNINANEAARIGLVTRILKLRQIKVKKVKKVKGKKKKGKGKGLFGKAGEEQGQEEKVEEQEVKDVEGRLKTIDLAVEVAQQICKGGPIAIREALKAVKEATESAENAAYDAVLKTKDRREALVAFWGGREPVFKGE